MRKRVTEWLIFVAVVIAGGIVEAQGTKVGAGGQAVLAPLTPVYKAAKRVQVAVEAREGEDAAFAELDALLREARDTVTGPRGKKALDTYQAVLSAYREAHLTRITARATAQEQLKASKELGELALRLGAADPAGEMKAAWASGAAQRDADVERMKAALTEATRLHAEADRLYLGKPTPTAAAQ